jgi:hypothetical protein
MIRTRLLPLALPLLLATGLSACAMTMRTRFDRYGNVDSQEEPRQAVATPADVEVFYGTSPGGFSLRDNELKVEAGYHHRILGTAVVVQAGGKCGKGDAAKKDVIDQLRQAAFERGGNAVIYAISYLSDEPVDEDCKVVRARGSLGSGWVVLVDHDAEPDAPPVAPAAPAPAAPEVPAPDAPPAP